MPMQPDMNWVGVLEHHARRTPHKPLAVSGNDVVNYRAMQERAAAVAGGLQARGVGSGDVVGLLSYNNIEFLTTIFAANHLGAIAMPINWRLAAPELRFILEHSQARALVCDDALVELANDVNDHMPDYVVRRLVVGLNRRSLAVNGRRVLLLGLSYKRNTGDARESPSQPIARQLVQLGAIVMAADPYVDSTRVPAGVEHVDVTPELLASVDAVVFLVDHDEFDTDLVAQHAPYVLDARHRLPARNNVEYL